MRVQPHARAGGEPPPAPSRWRRRRLLASIASIVSVAAAAAGLSACAQWPRKFAAGQDSWSGRLSLQVASEPPQSFAAGFELRGSPSQGELVLNTPLGTTLLSARWTPGEALLEAGSQTRRFASIDELIEMSTGATLPVLALFDWLAGKSTASGGWTADLSRQPEGRISARRNEPQPPSELRIVLDQASL